MEFVVSESLFPHFTSLRYCQGHFSRIYFPSRIHIPLFPAVHSNNFIHPSSLEQGSPPHTHWASWWPPGGSRGGLMGGRSMDNRDWRILADQDGTLFKLSTAT